MNEPIRKQQTAEVISHASKPFGWFFHLKYVNDEGQWAYGQVGIGPNPDRSNGVFPLWVRRSGTVIDPVVISCPVPEAEMFMDYTGDLLVPIQETIYKAMFVGGH